MRRIVSRAAPSYARIGRAQFRSKRLRVSKATFALTGTDATVRLDSSKMIVAGAVSFSLTGQNATLKAGRKLAAVAATYALTGQATTLRSGKRLVAGAASFALTGQSATLKAGRKLAAGAASYSLTGQDSTLRNGKRIAADSAAFALTGQAATLRRALALAAASTSFALTGQNATLVKGQRLAADAVSFSLTGQTATLKRALKVAAGTTSFALTGQTATLKRALKVVAGTTSFALTGQAATLTKASSARTFTFIGSCVSYTSSLNFGSLSAGSIAAGDIAVFIDYATGATIPSAVTPSGFTTHINTSDSLDHVRAMVSTKKLDGTETSITGVSGSSNNKIGLVFRPSTSFTTITASDTASQITRNNPSLQACDPSAETTAAIVIGMVGIEGGTAAFSKFSPAADGTVATADADLIAGYKIYNTSPQSTSIDMNDLGNANWLASLYLTVS